MTRTPIWRFTIKNGFNYICNVTRKRDHGYVICDEPVLIYDTREEAADKAAELETRHRAKGLKMLGSNMRVPSHLAVVMIRCYRAG